MKHRFTRWLTCVAMLLTLGAFTNRSHAAERGFVYVGGAAPEGSDYAPWYTPVADNAAHFEALRMFETSEGSGIYEGMFNFPSVYFRFYYDLADLPQETASAGWRMNVIHPRLNTDGDPGTALGRSGITLYDDVEKAAVIPSYVDPGCWRVPASGTYKLRLDLNEGKLWAIPSGTYLLLVNDESTPTLATADRYVADINLNDYVEACDLRVYRYDFVNGLWCNPPKIYEELTSGYNRFRGTMEYEKGAPFVADQWPGGVVTGGIGSVTLSGDTPFGTPLSVEMLYAVGDMNDWMTSDGLAATPLGSDGTKFEITLPVGSREFKFVDESQSWMGIVIGQEADAQKSADGSSIIVPLSTINSAGNFRFSYALESPVTAAIDLTAMTMTLPADAPYYTAGVAGETPMYVVPADATFQPWKGASAAVLSSFGSLSKQPDGTYSGSVKLDGSRFNIVSTLADKGGVNTVLAPPTGGDRSLVTENGMAWSRAKALPADKAGCWTLPAADGGYVTVTVTPGDDPAVKFETGGVGGDRIYLIGMPQGWDIMDGSWPLLLTDKGGYYGSFDIAEGEAMFRFYTELGYWDAGSYGYVYDDSVNDLQFVDGDSYRMVRGKGVYNFIDWPGGKMYIYVRPGMSGLVVSASPIAEAGEIAPYDPDKVKESLYVVDAQGDYTELDKQPDGTYTGGFSLREGNDGFRLFTKRLPISPEEPEWEGSYALSAPSASFALEPDGYGVAEASFTAQNSVNTSGSNAFSLKNMVSPSGWDNYRITVDPAAGKLYLREYNGNVWWLVGPMTSGESPTVATCGKYPEAAIPAYGWVGAKVINIPAGQFSFYFDDLNGWHAQQQGMPPSIDQTVAFADRYFKAPVTESEPWYGYFQNYGLAVYNSLSLPGWEGGYVAVSPMELFDMRGLAYIYASTGKYDEAAGKYVYEKLKVSADDPLVFEGELTLGGNSYLQFALGGESGPVMGIGSVEVMSGTGTYVNQGAGKLSVGGSTVTAPLSFHGNSFTFPDFVGEGAVKLRVDLRSMKMTAEVKEVNQGMTYEAVAGDGSDLDGAVAYPSASQEGAVTVAAQVKGGAEGTAFNFTAPDGTVIQPAGGAMTEIEFDATGSWSGPFVKKAAAASSRKMLRAKAATEAKWHFSLPEGAQGIVNMLIDEKSNRLTVHSADCNKGFFIVPRVNYAQPVAPSIENLETLKGSMLKETVAGVYEGDFEMPKDAQEFRVAFCSSLYDAKSPINPTGISYMLYEFGGFDMTEETEASNPAMSHSMYSYATEWQVIAPQGKVHVRYDRAANTLAMTRGNSAIGDTEADAAASDGLTVIPGDGCIKVIAPEAAMIDIYTAQGSLIRSVSVAAGTTIVDMEAGFYIVNRAKLFVR